MSTERVVSVRRGAVILPILIVLLPVIVAILIGSLTVWSTDGALMWFARIGSIVALVAWMALLPGFFTLQPNEARVLILFGTYKGTVRAPGFHWANPFYSNGTPGKGADADAKSKKGLGKTSGTRFKISLRARTLLGAPLKVNDRRGNPVEIAAMVVWHVADTAQAVFDVDDYESYVSTQAESALRHVATAYDYDHGAEEADDAEVTLRGNPDEVAASLRADLGNRLSAAGVVVDDARLTHLAYAPEIAQAMLRRQQAEAVIAARRKIVNGAVSMVEMALQELEEKSLVDLDPERRAAMVSNLLVVLCGETDVTPVLNTGTLYQ